MNARSLAGIVAEELATIGIEPSADPSETDRVRRTEWSARWPGFGVRHYRSGRCVYVVQARMTGKVRTVTIGDARVVTRAQAADVARRVLLRAEVGENPAEARAKVRASPTYDAFLDEYWSKVEPTWKASTRARNRYYRCHLDRAFRRRFLDEIMPADIKRWFAQMTANVGPAAANRTFELLRSMFNKAEAWGVLAECSNPCIGVKANKLKRHECVLSEQELNRFGDALAEIEEADPMAVAALRLLALTGCRKSEICELAWSEVRGRRLLLHDAKTGPRTVWLGEAAQAVLARLPHHADLDHVFWRGDARLTISRLDQCYYRARAMAGLAHVRLHDLRHSFASHAASMSETLPMISRLLGHTSVKMTARYAHLDDACVVDAAERLGELLRKATGEGL